MEIGLAGNESGMIRRMLGAAQGARETSALA
jgi:hypothetical protein